MSKSWDKARADRDAGMAHAASGQEGWMEEAVEFSIGCVVTKFRRHSFMTEEIVELARGVLNPPRDPRAWGPVMKRVEKMGYIVNVGYAPARTSNTSPKVRWAAREGLAKR